MSAELLEVLRAQGTRWPAMMAQDILKLLYQHSFGGGHLIRNEEEMNARLREEYLAARPVEGLPLFEPLGGRLGPAEPGPGPSGGPERRAHRADVLGQRPAKGGGEASERDR